MGNIVDKYQNTEDKCNNCPGEYLCIKCYKYYCNHHITQHFCFNKVKCCKLCPTIYM